MNVRRIAFSVCFPRQRIPRVSVKLFSSQDRPEDDVGDIQPHWLAMERRVLHRKPKLKGEGPSGRGAVPKCEEDMWLEGGAYHDLERPESKSK